MKQTAELVKKCQERMKSIRDKNYFTLRFGKTKMYSEKPFKKINMKQTAVEWLVDNAEDFFGGLLAPSIIKQAKAKEKSQKAEEYLKGFKDGKEYQIKLDELTFKTK